MKQVINIILTIAVTLLIIYVSYTIGKNNRIEEVQKKEGDNMKKGDRKLRLLVIMSLILAICCLSIGYSAYNEVLQINSNTMLTNNVWLIEFKNLSNPVVTGTASEKNSATFSSTSINTNVILNNPGDSIEYQFDIVNNGTIDAKLSSDPGISGIPDSIKDQITISLTYTDGTSLKENDVLNANESKRVIYKITYQSGERIEAQTINIETLLLFTQK